jgi:hypothetical protein
VPKLKVYLDTSIINFLYADDAPEYQKETGRFFEMALVPGKIDAYISGIVTGEINATKEIAIRNKLLDTFTKYPQINNLAVTAEEEANNITLLSEAYISLGIIPRHKLADALHVAYKRY